MNISPEAAGFSPQRLKRVDALLQGYVDRGELAGMIAQVVRRDQTAYYARFGWMDREAQKPMRDDTLFIVASMTKPVTSVAIMLLYEEGRFYLNTPISRFIPAFADTKVFVRETDGGLELAELNEPLTFRHLFTHTAGLSYGGNPQDPVDRQYQVLRKHFEDANAPMTNKLLAEELPKLPLAFQPGTHWRYSMAIDVLGCLIEVISGQPLDVFLRERLFAPLGMVDTDFYVPPEKAERIATVYGHAEPDKGLQRMEQIVPPSALPPWISGGGGLVSTARDYGRFAQMLANGGELDGMRILGPKTVGLFGMNHAPAQALPYSFGPSDIYHLGYGYSLGTRVLVDVSMSGQAGSVGEFGWDGAYSTYFWVDPREAMYGLLLLQHHPNAYYPIHPQFKQIVYQALVR